MNFTNFLNEDQQINPKMKYELLGNIGEGVFGNVSKCRNRLTGELVALKLLKDDCTSDDFYKELEILDRIKELDPDSFNLVKLVDVSDYDGYQSLAFEMLDASVEDLLQKRKCFTLSQIRTMAKQLLIALYGLQCVGVIHTDIKLDNIMLVNHKEQPFKVKLIDFGVALGKPVETGKIISPVSFRAPEVTLGLPIWEAVDMWSLACCFLHFYSCDTNFFGYSEFDYLTRIVQFLGVPSEKLLNEAMYTKKYFVQENSKWRLKTLQEFKRTTRPYPEMPVIKPRGTNLEELLKASRSCVSNKEERDMEQFHNLLSKMLELDAVKRITPSEALLHPFITMAHLPEGDDYTKEAHKLMRVTELGGPQYESNKKTFETAKIETDITLPNPVSCASDDNIFSDATKSPGEISVCWSEKSTEHSSANEDTGFLVASTKEAHGRNQETSPGEIMVGSICLSTELQSEGEAVSEEVTPPNQDSCALDDIFFTACPPTLFGFADWSNVNQPATFPGEIPVCELKDVVEFMKMEIDIKGPTKRTTCASDDNIVFDATKSPGEISVCGSEKSTEHPSANEDTDFLVASTKELHDRNQETSPGEIMVGSICLSTELQSEGEAVNEEVTHNEEQKSQLEEDHSRIKSVDNMASKTSQTVFNVDREAIVIKFGESIDAGAGKIQQDEPNNALAIEVDVIVERVKEDLLECSEILEDIKRLFQDGEATEADINQLTRKASKSFFCRLIPPKKPVFRKPNWVKHIPVFKRRSTASGRSKH